MRSAPPLSDRVRGFVRVLLGSVLVAPALVAGAAASAGQHAHHDVLRAGQEAMGFDQTRTFHHFRLRADGGVIEVHVNDPNDEDTKRRVATHLEHISRQFAAGDFAASLATHGEEPPGVATMKALRARLRFTFLATPVGGRVRISSDAADAVAAVHTFLRYQIREHRTGDSPEVECQDGR